MGRTGRLQGLYATGFYRRSWTSRYDALAVAPTAPEAVAIILELTAPLDQVRSNSGDFMMSIGRSPVVRLAFITWMLSTPSQAHSQGALPPASTETTAPDKTATEAAAQPADPNATNPAPSLPPAVLEEAQRIYKMGQDAYQKGRYESAFNSFQQAYQLTNAPDLLYNLAKVANRLGQKEVAVGYYKQYLAGHPEDEAAVQKELDDYLGQNAVVKPLPQAPEPQADPQVPRWVQWALIGTGAGLLGLSVGLLVAGGVTPAETAADQTQRRSMLASGGVLGGIGLAATVGGVVLRLRSNRVPAPKTTRLWVSPTGNGILITGIY